jgi:glycosyltransferase involved in cell wall biosynthesis
VRVLHVTESLPGGIATYFREILPYQIEHLGASQVCVLVPEAHQLHLPQPQTYGCVTYARSGRNPASLLRLATSVLRCLRTYRPDIVHAHSSFAGAVVRLCGLLLTKRPKIIYCAHGWAFLRDAPAWQNRVYAYLERALAGLCDGIINISNHEYRCAQAAGIPGRISHVIRYGLAPADTDGDRPAPLSLDRHRLNFFFIGRHDRQKGLDVLLEVFSRLPRERFSLHVAGGSVLGDTAPELAVGGDVRYLGWLDPESVDAYCRLFDAVIVPSRWEGFGLVVLEAMRNGVAVIASNRGTLPEIVIDGCTGHIFDFDDPASLEALFLNADRPRLRTMGLAGKHRFEAEFLSRRMNEETLALYRSVLQP